MRVGRCLVMKLARSIRAALPAQRDQFGRGVQKCIDVNSLAVSANRVFLCNLLHSTEPGRSVLHGRKIAKRGHSGADEPLLMRASLLDCKLLGVSKLNHTIK